MSRPIYHRGAKFTLVFARSADGSYPAQEFFDALGQSDRLKVARLFHAACETGNFGNDEKYGDLGDGLYEFKSFQIRMPFAYCGKQRSFIVVTHGFIKKRDKASKEEIAKARRIFEEDQAALPKLELIHGKKKK